MSAEAPIARADVVVVGAGVMGASIAFQLSRKSGKRVVVVDGRTVATVIVLAHLATSQTFLASCFVAEAANVIRVFLGNKRRFKYTISFVFGVQNPANGFITKPVGTSCAVKCGLSVLTLVLRIRSRPLFAEAIERTRAFSAVVIQDVG